MKRALPSFRTMFSSLLASAVLTLFAPHAMAAQTAHETANKVIVMTSYPEEVVSLIEAGFEKAYPGTRVEIVWRRSGDAMNYLKDNPGHTDVYWTPSQRTFAMLAEQGAFKRLPVDMAGLPAKVGGFPISDPDQLYAAAEISGFGFAVNTERLRAQGLPRPAQWTDLAEPRWRDELTFPVPSRAAFAPPLVEIVAQGYGWEKGWAILQQVGANSRAPSNEAPNSTNSLSRGQVTVNVSMDFFIKPAMEKGAPIEFVYPGVTGYSPAHIAVFKDAPNPDAARNFAHYVLSEDAQKLLFHPDMLRLPVRPSVYADKPEGYYDPFTAAQVMPFEFDNELAQKRQGLNIALYDVMVTNPHAQLREALATVARAEQAAGGDPALQAQAEQARKLVTQLPITEAQATELSDRFVASFEFENQPNANDALLRGWAEHVAQNRQQARRIAQQVIAAKPGAGSGGQ